MVNIILGYPMLFLSFFLSFMIVNTIESLFEIDKVHNYTIMPAALPYENITTCNITQSFMIPPTYLHSSKL